MSSNETIRLFPDYLATGLWSNRELSFEELDGLTKDTIMKIKEWVSTWELWNIDMDPPIRTITLSQQWINTVYAPWFKEGQKLAQLIQQETGIPVAYYADTPDEIK